MISTRVTPWSPKLLAFMVPSVIGGAAFWFFVQQALRGHVIFNEIPVLNVVLYLLMGIIFLAIWLGPLLLIPYVATWRSIRLIAVGVALLPFVFFFPFLLWTWLSVVLMFAGLGWGIESVNNDAHNRLSVQPVTSVSRGASVIIFSVLVAISLMYFQQLRGSSSSADELSDKLIEQTVTITERALPTYYRDYREGMTIDELIGAQIPTADTILRDINFNAFTNQTEQQEAVEQKLEALGLDSSVVQVDVQKGEAQVRAQIDEKLLEFHKQTVDQAREELAKRLDIPLKGSDTVHDALERVIGKQFNTYIRRYVSFVPVLLALALFFILRIFTSLLQACVVWFGWLYFRLCRLFKLIHITHQTVPAEKVEWL